MSKRSTMSPRTRGVAVAVRASMTTSPSSRRSAPSLKYEGRKSCPHSEMQCASSMHKSAGFTSAKVSASDSSDSGVVRMINEPPLATRASTWRRVVARSVLSMRTTGTPRWRSFRS